MRIVFKFEGTIKITNLASSFSRSRHRGLRFQVNPLSWKVAKPVSELKSSATDPRLLSLHLKLSDEAQH